MYCTYTVCDMSQYAISAMWIAAATQTESGQMLRLQIINLTHGCRVTSYDEKYISKISTSTSFKAYSL